MDHHCIWTQTCIGFSNQKSFYLFCMYMTMGVMQFWYFTVRVLKEKSPFLIWLSLALLFYGCSLDFLHCLWEWWLWLCSALTRWWSLQISERWTAWRAVRFARSLFCPLKTTLKEYYPTNQDKPLRQRRNLKHQRHIWKRLVVVVGPDPSPSREWPLPIKDGSPPRQVIAHEIHKHVWDRAAILQIYELLIRTDKYSLHW